MYSISECVTCIVMTFAVGAILFRFAICFSRSKSDWKTEGHVTGVPSGRHAILGTAGCRCGTTQEIRPLGQQRLIDAVKAKPPALGVTEQRSERHASN